MQASRGISPTRRGRRARAAPLSSGALGCTWCAAKTCVSRSSSSRCWRLAAMAAATAVSATAHRLARLGMRVLRPCCAPRPRWLLRCRRRVPSILALYKVIKLCLSAEDGVECTADAWQQRLRRGALAGSACALCAHAMRFASGCCTAEDAPTCPDGGPFYLHNPGLCLFRHEEVIPLSVFTKQACMRWS